ncbi:hypothetical protein F5Y14DRAFT_413189 [Nemania sp. NC0429]|nr:hypothetical protein F5Y14DRAFT_413189 [Nemania sp. NC0429]
MALPLLGRLSSFPEITVTSWVVASFAGYHYHHMQVDDGIGLTTSKCIGNGLLVLVISTFLPRTRSQSAPTLSSLAICITFIESILAVAWLLGSAPSDVLLTHTSLYIHYLCLLFKDLRDPSKSVPYIAAKTAAIHVWSVACFSLVSIAVTGFVFSWSEVSAGGNYNLHYLPTSTRRELRPDMTHLFGRSSAVPSTATSNSSTGYYLRPGTPFSIYLPSGGFLWSDNLVWDDKFQSFDIDDVTRATVRAWNKASIQL